MLRWKKQDVQRYVFYFRENRPYENLQDPSFKGRVELKDPEMKNGELSVILKNVTVKDNGVYECSAAYSQQQPQLLNSITLTVDPPELRVKQGENATLECYGPKDAILVMLRWNRPNLQSHEYVFYFSDDQIQEDKQHPSFKGRVNLKDPEMKNGDFSVNLTNVVMNDSGRYECYAGYKGKKPELINSTYLKVEEPDVRVKRGETIILECYGPKYATTRLLKWYKSDVKSDFYVFYFRDGKPYENYQDPHFKGRVKLKDPEMNGDFSVILKNVTMNDAGKYECYAGHSNQEPKLLKSINLKVKEGQTGGHRKDRDQRSGSDGLEVGLLISAVLAAAAVLLI